MSPPASQWNAGALLVALTFGGGCNAVLGLDERPPRAEGGSAPTGSGGIGGVGGASGGAQSVGGAGGDGAGGAEPCVPSPDACGGVGELDDDFDDGAIDIQWLCPTQTGTGVGETGGAIEITLPSAPTQNRTAWCETQRYYDLVDRSVAVRVDEMANTSVNVRVFLELFGVDRTRLALHQRNGNLDAIIDPGGAPVVAASVPWDDSQRHWRFREACGELHWETSSDGASWTTLHSAASATLFDMTYVQARVGATVGPGVANPGQARFDDFDGEPDTVACPISDLSDDFADAMLGLAWGRGDLSGCTVTEPAGELLMQMSQQNGSNCRYASSTGFDMSAGTVSVRAVQHPDVGFAANAWLSVATEPGTGWVMGYELGVLFMGRANDYVYTAVDDEPFSDVGMAWWRLQEQSGAMLFLTSPDGTTWTERASTTNVFDLSAVEVVLGSEVEAPLPSGFDVRFDDVTGTP